MEKRADEYLDYLCWSWANQGETSFPPDEQASKSISSLYGDDELTEAERERALSRERAYFTYTYYESVTRFLHMKKSGFDPIQRAEREVERTREEHDEDFPAIDWEWLTEQRDEFSKPD